MFAARQAVARVLPRGLHRRSPDSPDLTRGDVSMRASDGRGSGRRRALPFSGEKLSPVLAVYRARDFAHAVRRLARRIYALSGRRSLDRIAQRDDERASRLASCCPCAASSSIRRIASRPVAASTTPAVFAVDGLWQLGRQQHLRQSQLPPFPQHHPRRASVGDTAGGADRTQELFGAYRRKYRRLRRPRVTRQDARCAMSSSITPNTQPDAPFPVRARTRRRADLSANCARRRARSRRFLAARGIAPGEVVSFMLRQRRVCGGAFSSGPCMRATSCRR